MERSLPKNIFSGYWKTPHCQGIAVDTKKQYVYYSFTTMLVKTDMQGNVIGTVKGLMGHLGCIDFNEADGKVYGSLEYKNDSIGRGILNMLGKGDVQMPDAFYIAIFDADKIDRMDMDACTDGVMKTAYLKTVVDDFNAVVSHAGREVKHRLGCSGIDGTAIGPMPGDLGGKEYLFVAYGVYFDDTRTDNDHQVILCYDIEELNRHCAPLSQNAMHQTGPMEERKLFVYTGNTEWGVQNLEYDAFTGNYFMAVYRGHKESFPNYPFFVVDGKKAPEVKKLSGVDGAMEGEMLTLLEAGEKDERTGVCGFQFPYGATGMCALGDGYYYFSHDGGCDDGSYTNVKLYKWDGKNPFTIVEE